MLARIWQLVLKEFVTLLKDPRGRVILLVPPLIQTFVFGYAATLDVTNVHYAVYDQDGGIAARELAARFQGASAFRQVAGVDSLGQARDLLSRGELLLVVHIGPDFTRDLLRHESAAVQLLVDGRNSNTASIVQGYAREVVDGFSRRWAEDNGWRQPPGELVTRAWFNPNLESRWFVVPGIIGLLLQVVVMTVTALSVAREREQGTFDQLLVTPMRPGEILLGKALPGFIIGLAEATLILCIAVFWFQVPLVGSLATLYAGVMLFLLAAVGVGLMISSLSVTMQQGLLGGFLYMVPAVILSGFATPIANMPLAVQYLTLANPMRYFMTILRGVFLEGASAALLWDQFWPLAVIGVVTLVLAGWMFRHRLN
ncbi:MAG: ABC transporter permease [Ectothiorhodospiraceae bacterium]|jgi:ABC-2 type transport system permease protein